MRSLLLLTLLVAVPTLVLGQSDDLPRLERRVTDRTNSLTPAEQGSLEAELKAFEDSTSNQVAILLVESAGDRGMEDFSNRVFEQARLGQEGKNNGVLIVVALNDRAVRFEVGYGLEGTLTDALSRQIIEREVLPRFRDGQYHAGLEAAVRTIAAAVAGEYTADRRGQDAPLFGSGLFITFLFIMIFVVGPLLRSRRRMVLTSRGRHYDGGWGWPGSFGGGGGGFGGGGFGGFSGGGGLSGGGGATGRW